MFDNFENETKFYAVIFSTCESFQYPKSFGFWITFIYFGKTAYVPQYVRGGHRTTCQSHFSPYTMWVPRIKIRWSGLKVNVLSHWDISLAPFSILEFWPKCAQFTWNNLNEKINLFPLSDKDHNAIHQSSSSPLDLLCVVWADQRHPQNSEHYSCYFFSFCLTLIGEGTNRNYVGNGSWCLRRAAGQRSSVESTYSLPLGDWWQRSSAF